MRAKKQLGPLAATLLFGFFSPPEQETSNNVRAFHVQVDGSRQGRAGPSTSASSGPTSSFTSCVGIQPLWRPSRIDLNFTDVICTVLDSPQTTFSESYKPEGAETI